MEEFEKGTPDGVAIESDGHLREGAGLTEVATNAIDICLGAGERQQRSYFCRNGDASQRSSPWREAGRQSQPLSLRRRISRSRHCESARTEPFMPPPCPVERSTNSTQCGDQAGRSECRGYFRPGKSEDATTGIRSAKRRRTSSSRYIWDLIFDSSGRLYIATGNPGAIYRVDVAKPGAKPELFFRSDEAHIRTLAWDAKGNLIAGTDGSASFIVSIRKERTTCFSGPTARSDGSCHRRERNNLRSMRGRQEPQPAAATAGAGDRLNQYYQWFSRDRSRRPTPVLPYRKERIFTR